MTDNFTLIKNFISNHTTIDSGDFYFVQVLKRRKDNPELKGDVAIVANYFFYSLDDFDTHKAEIVQHCQDNNARCYIRINKRNDKKIALQTIRLAIEDILSGNYKPKFEVSSTTDPEKSLEFIKVIVDEIYNKDYSHVKYAHLSACGQFASDPVKKWVIDVDDPTILADITEHLETFTTILLTLPTKSGYHIITPGFNPNLLTDKFKDVDLKKDSPTVLYVP